MIFFCFYSFHFSLHLLVLILHVDLILSFFTDLDLSFFTDLDLDFFFQYHLHEGSSAERPATDPIGSWDADGGIVNGGFMFTARF